MATNRQITIDLGRRANRSMIEGKRYADHIEEAASKLPPFTAQEINQAWSNAMNRREKDILFSRKEKRYE